MYPRNAASPPRIAIGAVVQISDGAVQTSGCTVRVIEQGGAEGDGGGTTSYSTDGVVLYTPTQAETDQIGFVLIAKKTGCIPVSQTIITSASDVTGYAGVDWAKVNAPTSTVGLTNTSIATPSDSSGVTTLLSRLSAARAGYLDNLSGGAVALASTILDSAGIRSALGLASANLDTQLAALPTANQNADALIGRNIEGGSSTGRTVAQALAFLRNKWEVSGATLTVYGVDDSTPSWAASVTQTAGNPISAVDPA